MLIAYNWKLGLTVIVPIVLGYSLIALSKRVQVKMNDKYFAQLEEFGKLSGSHR